MYLMAKYFSGEIMSCIEYINDLERFISSCSKYQQRLRWYFCVNLNLIVNRKIESIIGTNTQLRLTISISIGLIHFFVRYSNNWVKLQIGEDGGRSSIAWNCFFLFWKNKYNFTKNLDSSTKFSGHLQIIMIKSHSIEFIFRWQPHAKSRNSYGFVWRKSCTEGNRWSFKRVSTMFSPINFAYERC